MYFDEPEPFEYGKENGEGINAFGKDAHADGRGENWVDTTWKKAHKSPVVDTDRASNGSIKTTVNIDGNG